MAHVPQRTKGSSKANQQRRRLEVARLLVERVPYGDVVRTMSEKWACSPRSIKYDVASCYADWKDQLKEQAVGNLGMGIEAAQREIRRIRHRLAGSPNHDGELTRPLDESTYYRLSMGLLNWERHLLKCQGVLVGRVEVGINTEPVRIVCDIPAGPFGLLAEPDGA